MWQKKGAGPQFQGRYQRDNNGERIMILTGVTTKGEWRVVTAESWQMLKEAGWKKVASARKK